MKKQRRFGWVKVLAVVLALPFGLSSCSDDTFDGDASDLHGTWLLERYESERIENGTVDPEYSYERECDENNYQKFTLNSDGTMEYTRTYSEVSEDGLYREIMTYKGAWTLIKDVLIFHAENEGCISYTVKDVDNNTLTLTATEKEEGVNTYEGEREWNYETIYTNTFKRVK